ncbi:LysR family transcriptional regulator [Rhodoblastus acidophilus]|uniref:LysR family transcriptional regulator n=1 Tax=Candidatus Rhodoblastus alkanivorans TaxID=2954117 RepID=A0ABS9Z6F6_9HYPH|nr:LysR family transcriptional regulator [Candidatus Rhodoblastus alkanivorans]MCI4679710.1 LysR family transcriptional regulator [Candidatus Rhodoblastus alkanivorans]MCI4683228.1 LysR family transcriptional regulator [Candidatus Rhodoblastus alkanivorans]MDI4640540.1 LysR family transcriptional regulator [Rhodoblastus acidophilus]
MRDRVSLDQIRTFIVAAEEGSFSAAARKLGRAQSAVSDLVRRLEDELGVGLFDRSGRAPRLTSAGKLLLRDARAVGGAVDFLNFRAKGLSEGIEPELCAVIDVYFPFQAITEAAKEFRLRFPATPLRIYVEVLGASTEPVLDGRASFAVVGGPTPLPPGLSAESLAGVAVIMVAAPDHPLAALKGVIPQSELAKHIQLVLTERASRSTELEYSVMSPTTWRLADLYAKHSFLLNGIGWGSMPLHAVERDLAEGRLVRLVTPEIPSAGLIAPMTAVYRTAAPPGPAGRWLIERLKSCPSV